MKKLREEKFYIGIFTFLAAILFGGLFFMGLVYTGCNPDIYDEYVTLIYNNPLRIFGYLSIGGLFLYGADALYRRFLKKIPRNVILIFFMATGLILAISYALTTATRAQADALSLAMVASEVNNSTVGVYAPDSYIGVYSHQLGFVTLLRIFFRLFGDMNYRAIQLAFAFLVPLIMLSGSGIIRILMKDNEETEKRSEFMFLLLSFFCLPVYMYVLFIYGDIVYTALTLTTAWILLSSLDKFSWIKVVLFGILCGVEYLCKSNSLIVFVAYGLVLLISLLNKDKRKTSLLLLVFMGLFIVLLPKANDALYSHVMPGTDAMPSIAWVGMGMNDDYGRAGWNNFYNQIAFAEAGYDGKLTKIRVMSDIRATLGVWFHNPVYMLDFFNRKINLQWSTPLYQGMVMNNAFDAAAQTGLGALVYGSPQVRSRLEVFMKIYQLMMYLVLAVGLTRERKRGDSAASGIEKYVLLIAVFGGFLFSLMWEAKTRYIFPYLVMTIPYFAMSAVKVIDWIKYERKEKITDRICGSFSDDSFNKTSGLGTGNYQGIDLFKFIMAIMVIVIHTVPYMTLKSELAVTAVQSFIFCAVPFFFISSGFLLGQKLWNTDLKSEKLAILKAYLFKILKMYLIWSLVYFPLAVVEYVRNGFSFGYSVFLYLRGLFFIGEHYNSWILWYLLATIYAVAVLMLMVKLNARMDTVMWLGTLMFIVAQFGEYVFEFGLDNPGYSTFIAIMTKCFYTCRVFKGMFYIPLGIWLYCKMAEKTVGVPAGTALALIGYILSLTGLFKDFSIAICSLGIFIFAVSLKLKESNAWKLLRGSSTVTYFIHMLVYTGVYFIWHGRKTYSVGEFAVTAIISLAISFAWVLWGQNMWKKKVLKVY